MVAESTLSNQCSLYFLFDNVDSVNVRGTPTKISTPFALVGWLYTAKQQGPVHKRVFSKFTKEGTNVVLWIVSLVRILQSCNKSDGDCASNEETRLKQIQSLKVKRKDH